MATSPRINYLNNRDILAEIHKSKTSYCSFTKPHYHQYDIIVESMEEINDIIIEEAKQHHATRLGEQKFNQLRAEGNHVRLSECITPTSEILDTDIIIRIMTYDHIPLAPGRKKTPKRQSDHHERVNFPPFQHWKFSEDNNLICVGKSHWKGDLDDGEFSINHGNMTNELADMIIKLCERYATRGNVRQYTYVDEMQNEAIIQLIKVGLQFNESKSQNPFSYFTQILSMCFIRVINQEKRNQEIRDDLLEMHGLEPSYTRTHNREFAAAKKRNDDYYGE